MLWVLTMLMAAFQAAPRADAGRGQALFVKYGCQECHGREGQGAPSSGPRIGPNPLALPAFTRALRSPRNYMPPYTNRVVSDQDIADIHAFLTSRPRPASPSVVEGASDATVVAPGGTLRV